MQKIFPSDFDFGETIKYNLDHRKNVLVIIVGQQRSGKSYAGLQLCETYDSKFDKNAICFSMKDFMQFVRTQRNKWVLFDEVGVEFDNVLWWSTPIRIMKYIVETYASRQINLVMTLPNLVGMSTAIKDLSYFIIRMHQPRYGLLIGIWTDHISKMGYKWLQHLEFGMPSQSIIEDYEKKKDSFLSKKSIDWSRELGLLETKDDKRFKFLGQLLGSGIRGDAYTKTYKEYINLKDKLGRR
jgi:hypothetical protein